MEIWRWAPAEISDNAENWAELISTADSGYEKRRMKASRPLWSATYTYSNRQRAERNEMFSFIRARKGPHEAFYVPSFMWDAQIGMAYSSGTTLIVSDNSIILDALQYDRRYIWLINGSGQNEVATVTGSSGSGTLYIASQLTYDYTIGCEIDVCYVARINDKQVSFTDNSYYKHNIDIGFIEVR